MAPLLVLALLPIILLSSGCVRAVDVVRDAYVADGNDPSQSPSNGPSMIWASSQPSCEEKDQLGEDHLISSAPFSIAYTIPLTAERHRKLVVDGHADDALSLFLKADVGQLIMVTDEYLSQYLGAIYSVDPMVSYLYTKTMMHKNDKPGIAKDSDDNLLLVTIYYDSTALFSDQTSRVPFPVEVRTYITLAFTGNTGADYRDLLQSTLPESNSFSMTIKIEYHEDVEPPSSIFARENTQQPTVGPTTRSVRGSASSSSQLCAHPAATSAAILLSLLLLSR